METRISKPPRLADPQFQSFTIGGFEFGAAQVKIVGSPTWDDVVGAFQFARRAHKCSGWWLADMMRHLREHPAWSAKMDQLQDATGLSEKTMRNVEAIGAIPPARRRDNVEFGLHAEVIGLTADEQNEWLERTETEGWNRQELRQHIRASKRTKIIEGQAVLKGLYRVIYADPPWTHTSNGATEDGSLAKSDERYPPMSMEQIAALPVAAHAMPDSILFMWVTATMLYENPGPRDIIEAWGFKPKTGRVWNKVRGMPGSYGMQVVHEHLIIATRGSWLPNVPTPHDDTILTVRREGEHSSKPEEMRQFIEKHWTVGPYLELFGRSKHPGWDVFGNDARLWGA